MHERNLGGDEPVELSDPVLLSIAIPGELLDGENTGDRIGQRAVALGEVIGVARQQIAALGGLRPA